MTSRLFAILLVFAVIGSSLALFDIGGILVFGCVLAVASFIHRRQWPVGIVWLIGTFTVWYLITSDAGFLSREGYRSYECKNNLRQIAEALSNYEAEYHTYPPVSVADDNGRPMHSWRVLILPYLGEKALYDKYDFNEPWDGPANRKLLARRPSVFACPGDVAALRNGETTGYLAVVGKNAAWQKERSLGLDELGSPSDTVMLIESIGSGIPWTSPRDFDLDTFTPPDTSTIASPKNLNHVFQEGFLLRRTFAYIPVCLADGHQENMPEAAFSHDQFRDWLSVGGYKRFEIGSLSHIYGRSINGARCSILVVWIASVLLLFHQAWKSGRNAEKPQSASPVTYP